MKKIFFLVVFILFFIILKKGRFLNQSEDKLLIDLGCSIVDEEGKLHWMVNFLHCLYFTDGTYVAAKGNVISMYDNRNSILWSQEIEVHHQIKSYDNNIYFLSDKLEKINGEEYLMRSDLIIKMNRDGKILNSFNYSKAKKNLVDFHTKPKPSKRESGNEKIVEISHLNSFYRIPNDLLLNIHPAFKKGNYILTDVNWGRVSILSKDFDRLLWSSQIEFDGQVHDVQILKNGKVLAYLNGDKENGSRIAYVDLLNKRIKPIIGKSEGLYFYASWGGGVQILDSGNYLINAEGECNCAYIIDGNSNKIIRRFDKEKITGMRGFFQQAKVNSALGNFLRNNIVSP